MATERQVFLVPCGGDRASGHLRDHAYRITYKDDRNYNGEWVSYERVVSLYPNAMTANTHGLCPDCFRAKMDESKRYKEELRRQKEGSTE